MSEELRNEEVQTTETPSNQESVAAADPAALAQPQAVAPAESMADYAAELEESYKAFDERSSQTYVSEENPDAGKWQEFRQMMADKTVVKVKIKEIVKGGAIAYVNDTQAFIPASQIALEYVEKLEDWVGKYLEVVPITVDPERKKLVLSSRVVMKDKEEAQKAEKMASVKAGAVLEGVVDSLKDYGAFVDLDNGLTGLLHVSQISSQRIKHPGVVLKEGQKVTVKVIAVGDGRISLSMKALEAADEPKEEVFHYKETGAATTGLASLLKDIKL